MTELSIDSHDFFSSEPISIFPGDESLKGIFALLRHIDGRYLSRYSLIGDESYKPSLENIVKAFEVDYSYVIVYKAEITFQFNQFFIATNYSIQNGYVEGESHTYIKSWDLIGVDNNGNERIIDKHTDFQLCPTIINCDHAITKTFQIANPRPFKKYILRQYENSYPEFTYLLVRYIDFFGILCSENSSKACYFPHIKRTCQINHRLRIDFSFSFLFLSIL